MMLESSFQAQIVKFLRQRDALVFNFIGNVYQRDIPDLYIAHKYWSGWLELKTKNHQVTAGQRHNLTHLRRHNIKAYVVRETKAGTIVLSNPAEDWSEAFLSFDDASAWLTAATHETR